MYQMYLARRNSKPFCYFFPSHIYDINFNECSCKKTGGHPDHFYFLKKNPKVHYAKGNLYLKQFRFACIDESRNRNVPVTC